MSMGSTCPACEHTLTEDDLEDIEYHLELHRDDVVISMTAICAHCGVRLNASGPAHRFYTADE